MIMEKGISLNPPNRVASPDEAPPASRKDVSSSSPSDMLLSDSASRIIVESKVLEADTRCDMDVGFNPPGHV